MNGKLSGKLIALSLLSAVAGVLALGHGTAIGAPGSLLQTFLNPTPADWDYFGWSVAALGNNVVVGAIYDSGGAGAAYLFVPEPASAGLLLTGLLWLMRRRSSAFFARLRAQQERS